jgi:hypothetical protein
MRASIVSATDLVLDHCMGGNHKRVAVRRWFAVLLLATGVLMLTASTADARRRPKRTAKFESNKTFGLGVMLGGPTGICGKYYLTKDTALDFGVGAYYGYRRHYDRYAGLHVHGDFLWHPAVLTKNESFWLPIYVGIGARFLDHDDHDYSHLGVRVPFGLMFDFEKTPIDIFLEFALVADIVEFGPYDADDGYVDLAFAIGFRYYF